MAQKPKAGVSIAESYSSNFRKQYRRDGKPRNG